MDDEMSAADKPQQVTIVYRKPIVRPGTPEARAQGCLCRFESNMQAGFLTAERGFEDEVIVVIHKDCPLHQIVRKPMDDVLSDRDGQHPASRPAVARATFACWTRGKRGICVT